MDGSDSEKKARKFVLIDAQVNDAEKDAGSDAQGKLLSTSKSDIMSPSWQQPTYSKKELAKKRLIHPGMRDREVLNAFRSLRMSLQSKMQRFNSTILVSSVIQGGGSTFTAANLATAFTFELGKNALLIDCNLGSPSLARQLGIDASAGLYDYLSGDENDIANLIYPTMIPRLRLVPGGNLDSEAEGLVEFFTGERMRSFLNEVSERYSDRVIILDSPPILDSADTKVLAGLSDYIIVALPYAGATPRRVSKAIAEFGKNNITGFVMVN